MLVVADLTPVIIQAGSVVGAAGLLGLLFDRQRQAWIDSANQRELTLRELREARIDLQKAYDETEAERERRRKIEHDMISQKNAVEMTTALLKECEEESVRLRQDVADYRVETANYRADLAEVRRIMTVQAVELRMPAPTIGEGT